MSDGTKVCNGCKVEKPLDGFYRRGKNGRQPCCIPCSKAQSRAWKEANRATQSERGRSARLKYRYGIDAEQYDEMFARQGGACAICALPCRSGNRLAVDHHHDTGAVRGLLCRHCNTALGLMQDNPDRLRTAADYLEET